MNDDVIYRQAAIDVAIEAADKWDGGYNYERELCITEGLQRVPSAQPVARDTNVLSNDLIIRQEAIDAIVNCTNCGDEKTLRAYVQKHYLDNGWTGGVLEAIDAIEDLSSVQPTLYGYNIDHLNLIARVLEKENLSPERVAEALMDTGRIIEIVRDEVAEALRKAVEQCVTR